MNRLLVISLLGMFATSGFSDKALAGFEVGNGGDLIYCEAAVESPFAGNYVLDYVLTYNFSNKNADMYGEPQTPMKFAQIISKVSSKLFIANMALGSDFSRFIGLFKSTISTAPYVWKNANFGLIDIADEHLIEILPNNCKLKNPTGEKLLKQVIVREPRAKSVVFNFDPKVLGLIESNAQQLALLLVHEWLWSYTNDARIVRDCARFLMSTENNGWAGTEILQALENMGLQFDSLRKREIETLIIAPGTYGISLVAPVIYFIGPSEKYILEVINLAPEPVTIRNSSQQTVGNVGARLDVQNPPRTYIEVGLNQTFHFFGSSGESRVPLKISPYPTRTEY